MVKYFKKIIRESTPSVFLTTVIVSFSWTVLSINEDLLAAFPIIILIIPILNDLIGDLIIILTSRLSVHFVMGAIPMKFKWSPQIKSDYIGLVTTLILSLAYMMTLSLVYSAIIGLDVQRPFIISLIIVVAAIIIFHVFFFGFFYLSYIVAKREKDPNNVVIPFVTSLADFATPILLIVFVVMFL